MQDVGEEEDQMGKRGGEKGRSESMEKDNTYLFD